MRYEGIQVEMITIIMLRNIYSWSVPYLILSRWTGWDCEEGWNIPLIEIPGTTAEKRH